MADRVPSEAAPVLPLSFTLAWVAGLLISMALVCSGSPLLFAVGLVTGFGSWFLMMCVEDVP
jgi:hypothetical protein